MRLSSNSVVDEHLGRVTAFADAETIQASTNTGFIAAVLLKTESQVVFVR